MTEGLSCDFHLIFVLSLLFGVHNIFEFIYAGVKVLDIDFVLLYVYADCWKILTQTFT